MEGNDYGCFCARCGQPSGMYGHNGFCEPKPAPLHPSAPSTRIEEIRARRSSCQNCVVCTVAHASALEWCDFCASAWLISVLAAKDAEIARLTASGSKQFEMRISAELRADTADRAKDAALAEIARLTQSDADWSRQVECMNVEIARLTTLAGIGVWHDECRPNREMAARELQKSQAVIDKLADAVAVSNRAKDAAETALAEARRMYEHSYQRTLVLEADLTAARQDNQRQIALRDSYRDELVMTQEALAAARLRASEERDEAQRKLDRCIECHKAALKHGQDNRAEAVQFEDANARLASQLDVSAGDLDATKHLLANAEQQEGEALAQLAGLREALGRTTDYIRTAMRPMSVAEACGEGIWDRAHRSGLQHALNSITAEFGKADAALHAAQERPQGQTDV